jgi:hypothetical protein
MRINLSKTLKQLALGSAFAALTSGAFAATQGTTGFVSSGTVDITLSVNDEVKISNLTDITLGVFAGVDVSGTSSACVYRSGVGGLYNITATGDGAANAFTLTDGVATVAYGVEYDDGSGLSSLATGVALASTGGESVDDDCVTAGADNGTIQVTVTAAAASVLPASVYLGTLTLLVSPL